MLGVVLAPGTDLVAAVVAAESWRTVTGEQPLVLAGHADLVGPLSAALPDADVTSGAALGAASGDRYAALAALLADRPDGDVLVLLPPTVLVLAPPAPLVDAATTAGAAVAVRGRGPLPERDGERPTATDVASLGPLRLELLALRAGDPRATALLRWAATVPDGARGALLPVRCPEVALVDAPGIGVGWWNLAERPLSAVDGTLRAAGAPLAVADLPGWSAEHAHMLHPDMTRLRGSADPALRALVDDYAARWRTARARIDPAASVWPEDPVLAGLLDQAPEALREDALADRPDARERFARWAEQTDREDTLWGISRYLLQLRRDRHDLQVAFEDLQDAATAGAYLEWCRHEGPSQGVPARYVDASRTPAVTAPAVTAAGGRAAGVNLVGLLGEPALGVAEIARQVEAGLRAAGIPVASVAVDRRGRLDPADGDGPLPYDLTVACVNADLLPEVHRRLRHRLPADGRLVGLWWWELEQVPEAWAPALALVDEVWAGTRFVADAFRSAFDGPVRLVPLGLGTLAPAGALPAEVADDPRPYVLATFDYSSQIARKNPLAAIEAFALAGLAPRHRLVVKTVNGDRWPREQERVRLAALDAGIDDVLLLDGALAADGQAALVDRATAFLSLHRSEGLGLTVVEAMLRGTPVIATDYGGSTDVLDGASGWPVAFAAAAVPAGCGPYPEGATWAEPDVEAAAAALREVVAGGDDVTARVDTARVRAEARATRIANGTDLVAALREAAGARGRAGRTPDTSGRLRRAVGRVVGR